MLGPTISDVLPLAVGVMLSPIPIIAIILMLFSPAPERTASRSWWGGSSASRW